MSEGQRSGHRQILCIHKVYLKIIAGLNLCLQHLLYPLSVSKSRGKFTPNGVSVAFGNREKSAFFSLKLFFFLQKGGFFRVFFL